MTARRDVDRVIATWLTEIAPETHVDYLDETLGALGGVRQRPVWASPGRWLPAQLTRHRVAPPRLAPTLVLVALLLIATLVALAIVGSRPRLPAPFGLAGTGLVAFESGGDIVATMADGSGRRTLIADDGAQWGQVWSHRGDRFAYGSAPNIGDPASLWVADFEGRNRRLLTGQQTFVIADFLPAVNWSPDDRSLAFSANGGELSVVNADGTDLHRVGDDSQQRGTPAWSPDGTLLAYAGQPRNDPYTTMSSWVITPDGRHDLLVIPASGGDEFSNINPSWSPDGRSFLVHTGQSPNIDITIAERADDGTWTPRVIVGGPTADYHPSWSTSGTQFSFLRAIAGREPETYHLMVADADGSNVHQVADVELGHSPICWSPDDRFIRAAAAGRAEPGSERTILLIPLDGSLVVEIATPGGAGMGVCQMQRLAP
jgi:Tol biopolymer transport system component